jgi:dTDP-4-amino-4,6-dideoxygalactose transaminase
MVFPVRSTDRERLETDLSRRGVGTFVFGKSLHPTMSRAEFPEAGALSDSVLGLPVQQDLDARAIDAVADAYLAATDTTAKRTTEPSAGESR